MSGAPPGTAPGDLSIYSGRDCIGFIRGSPGGVHAYSAAGKRIGTFANRKAAEAALTEHAAPAVAR